MERFFLSHVPKDLRELNSEWVVLFNQVFGLREQLKAKGILDSEWENFLDVVINNFEEECHTKVEEDSLKYLAAIKNENLSFLSDDLSYANFLFFLCFQYFRTRKIKSNFLFGLSKKVTGINLEAVWSVLKYMLATNVSWNLYNQRDTMKLVLLKNGTSAELITGDQPAVNTFSTDIPPTQPVNDFELYYPVSPTIGILITNRPEFNNIKVISLDNIEVAKYNNHIIQNSHQQLYASRQQMLEQIL